MTDIDTSTEATVEVHLATMLRVLEHMATAYPDRLPELVLDMRLGMRQQDEEVVDSEEVTARLAEIVSDLEMDETINSVLESIFGAGAANGLLGLNLVDFLFGTGEGR